MTLFTLTTEERNHRSMKLDQMTTEEIVTLMNEEDQKVAQAVKEVLPRITEAVDMIYESLTNGGRMFYVGAGTSGRLGILDASECPPTFMTEPELVQAVMAGGEKAFMSAVEQCEDEEKQGEEDIISRKITKKDIVVGITASGRTPYPIGAVKYAKSIGARTIGIACNASSEIGHSVDCMIEAVVGPEVLTGSTRMKAATAQKFILNMLSTASMVKMGKVHENLMVDVHATNYKLQERAKKIVMDATSVSYEEASKLLEETSFRVKPAIVMTFSNSPLQKVEKALKIHNGYVREAVIALLNGEID
ncbi:MAG TPA: N-acetylmuramic acid 6-phosphate etherase [Bacillota bacterium]|nr:N-acetylmuramic acid 6-phosphate etherase [Bacillota bacterium]